MARRISKPENPTALLCRWRKLGIRRQARDLKQAPKRGWRFDQSRVDRVRAFFSRYLKHCEGEFAGKPFIPEGWQLAEIVAPIFGWVDAKGKRRFRTAYVEIPRKNGKTFLGAAIGLYLMLADGEMGAQVYSAATKRDQAKIVFTAASHMVCQSPVLKKFAHTFKTSIFCDATMSTFLPLAADYNTLDGLNPHAMIVDEVHAHKTRGLWDVLKSAQGARSQALLLAITTAGSNRDGICWELRQYAEAVLKGEIQDDSFFAFIASADEKDDPFDERTWAKANPNLGVSVSIGFLRSEALAAAKQPSALPSFRRYYLNQWVQAVTTWLNMGHWRRCNAPVDLAAMRAGGCVAALDLSTRIDLTAFVLACRMGDEVCLHSRFWLPEEDIEGRERRDAVPYRAWARDGFLRLTPGPVIDYDIVEADIVDLVGEFGVREVAYDPWNATQISQRLQEVHGIRMVEHRQGYRSMSPAAKEFEGLVQSRKLRHGNNPVLTWQAGNAAIQSDPAGNIKPVKPGGKSAKRIDGIVAAVMATGVVLFGESSQTSVYADNDLAVL
jgi:phage terminase large subunit-like protein